MGVKYVDRSNRVLPQKRSATFRDAHVRFGLAPCRRLPKRPSRRIGLRAGLGLRPSRAWPSRERAGPQERGLLGELSRRRRATGGSSSLVHGGTKLVLDRAIGPADAIASNNSRMVRRYNRALVERQNIDHQKGL